VIEVEDIVQILSTEPFLKASVFSISTGRCGLELKQWRCFVTLAEIGNIRRASSLLALSQPTLSGRIKQLEEDLGYVLFDRQARGVQLTERGARLLQHAKNLLSRSNETDEAARLIGRGAFDRLEIGVTSLAAMGFMPDALRAMAVAHPQAALALTEGSSHELEEAVAQKRLDFAVVHPPSSRDDLVLHELAKDRFMAVVSAENPLAFQSSVSASQLGAQSLIGIRREVGPVLFDRLTAYFSRAGISAQISQCATSSISLMALVAAGAGVGLVVESVRRINLQGLHFIPLADEAPTLAYSLCHRPDLPKNLRLTVTGALLSAIRVRGNAVAERSESALQH
jgi:LysR family transcriptional regulator, benzoate and cis,cis-muconate-responsive activator of ben and cat genes